MKQLKRILAWNRIALPISMLCCTQVHAQASTTKWFYGEGVCAGGWTYDSYESCPDTSLQPEEISGRDPSCGESGQYEVLPNSCRHSDNGAWIPGSGLVVEADYRLKRIRSHGAPIDGFCQQAAKDAFPLPQGRMDGDFDVLISARVQNETDVHHECLEEDFFGQCTHTDQWREGDCYVHIKRGQYPLKEDAALCGVHSGGPIYKTCVVRRIYPQTARPECGPIESFRTAPFSSIASIKTSSHGNYQCLSGDDLPDVTADELNKKVEYLLSGYNNNNDYDKDLVLERRAAMARYLMRTRAAEIREDLVERIWLLNPSLRVLPRTTVSTYSAADVKVKVGEKVDSLHGVKQLIYASAPKYADGVAVCWNTNSECAKPDARWVFMQLARYLGTRYVYSGAFQGDAPSVFSVRAYIAGEMITREIKRGVNEDQQLEPADLETGKWFTVFTKRSDKKLMIADIGNGSIVSSFNFFATPSPDGKAAFNLADGKLQRWNLKTGALEKSWTIETNYQSLLFAAGTVFVTDGESLFDAETGVKVTLEGLDSPLYANSLVGGANVVAADIGDHTVKVWSTQTGKVLATITHSSNSHFPVDDSIKFFGELMAVKSYNEPLVRVYKTNGTLVRTFKSAMEAYTLNAENDRLITATDSIMVFAPDNDQPVKTLAAEANVGRYVVSVSADMKKAFVYTRKTLPGNNNNPFGGPLPAYKTMEVWDLESGQRLSSLEIPGDMDYVGLANLN